MYAPHYSLNQAVEAIRKKLSRFRLQPVYAWGPDLTHVPTSGGVTEVSRLPFANSDTAFALEISRLLDDESLTATLALAYARGNATDDDTLRRIIRAYDSDKIAVDDRAAERDLAEIIAELTPVLILRRAV